MMAPDHSGLRADVTASDNDRFVAPRGQAGLHNGEVKEGLAVSFPRNCGASAGLSHSNGTIRNDPSGENSQVQGLTGQQGVPGGRPLPRLASAPETCSALISQELLSVRETILHLLSQSTGHPAQRPCSAFFRARHVMQVPLF